MRNQLVLAFLFSCTPAVLLGQTSIPPNQAAHFRDTSSLKPPAGAKVAIIEYEDLECPFCAHAFPFVHIAANRFHVPLEEHDFQIPSHMWSHEAAIFAHYLKAKVSPELAVQFRREVFASQSRIASRDDLRHFEEAFMKAHGKPMPAAVDPTGEFDHEVKASTDQGRDLGIMETPTIFVVTENHWIQVKDPDQMDDAVKQAEAEAGTAAPPAAHHAANH